MPNNPECGPIFQALGNVSVRGPSFPLSLSLSLSENLWPQTISRENIETFSAIQNSISLASLPLSPSPPLSSS